ncbi:hypothetical protein BKA62DRAFT_701722 [Auriculariales sp. MPI-PUGE-AT-0066]|nr:hypothetical protein BKA62DRAFT_701722 [Auriculariales sp. MPI-PUGE-AT-0066]
MDVDTTIIPRDIVLEEIVKFTKGSVTLRENSDQPHLREEHARVIPTASDSSAIGVSIGFLQMLTEPMSVAARQLEAEGYISAAQSAIQLPTSTISLRGRTLNSVPHIVYADRRRGNASPTTRFLVFAQDQSRLSTQSLEQMLSTCASYGVQSFATVSDIVSPQPEWRFSRIMPSGSGATGTIGTDCHLLVTDPLVFPIAHQEDTSAPSPTLDLATCISYWLAISHDDSMYARLFSAVQPYTAIMRKSSSGKRRRSSPDDEAPSDTDVEDEEPPRKRSRTSGSSEPPESPLFSTPPPPRRRTSARAPPIESPTPRFTRGSVRFLGPRGAGRARATGGSRGKVKLLARAAAIHEASTSEEDDSDDDAASPPPQSSPVKPMQIDREESPGSPTPVRLHTLKGAGMVEHSGDEVGLDASSPEKEIDFSVYLSGQPFSPFSSPVRTTHAVDRLNDRWPDTIRDRLRERVRTAWPGAFGDLDDAKR